MSVKKPSPSLLSKRDGLAGLLLSRKRKLEELYHATVDWLPTEHVLQGQLYEQREQVFLDANDLAKGRLFNETTLPDRPDFTRLIPPKRQATQHIILGHPPSKRSDAKDSLRVSPSRDPRSKSKERDTSRDSVSQDGQDVKTLRAKSPTLALQEEDAQKQETPKASVVEPSSDQRGKEEVDLAGTAKPDLETQPDHHDLTIGKGIPDEAESRSTLDVSKTDQRPLESSQIYRTSGSPLPIAHPQDERKAVPRAGASHLGEQASSPNSTIGHNSSNTPGVTAASPDTSPENAFLDEMEGVEGQQVGPGAEKGPLRHAGTVHLDNESHSSGMGQSQQLLKRDIGQQVPEPSKKPSPVTPMSFAGHTPQQLGASVTSDACKDIIEQVTRDKSGDASSNVTAQAAGSRTPKITNRPLISVDTGSGSISNATDASFPPTGASVPDGLVDSPLSMAQSATPRKTTAVSASALSPAERMTTRVSSGAIRHKSVSEILGETPKPSQNQTDKSSPDKLLPESRTTSVSNAPGSAVGRSRADEIAIRLRQGDRREKERERSKLSTVVFAKPQAERTEGNELYPRGGILPHNEEKDYLYSLFVSQAYGPPRCPPLRSLLGSAHKTLTTANAYLDLRDQQDAKIMKRIYQLQYSNRWPLRQQERSQEPSRPKSHWDYLLDEAKWMRTDFREERKWKLVVAKQCADWCAEYVASDPEQQSLLRVKIKTPPRSLSHPQDTDVEMADPGIESLMAEDGEVQSQPTPDLVPSAGVDTPGDSPVEVSPEYPDTIAPAAIFSLSSEEVIFDIRRTPAAEKILGELPLYQPLKAPEPEGHETTVSADASWKKDVLPVSRYVESRITLQEHKPPSKRSRYEYELEDQDVPLPPSKRLILSPEQVDVGLFNPEHKAIRDRIHPGHAFRPPSEFPMPTQAFFESRNSSQWTYNEDDELRKLVKEYSYNWSLISSCLSSKSLFSSGPERRTPWECFERWVNLEGLPADMSKTVYFRTYHSRLEAANRNVIAQQAALQAQQGNNPTQPVRRRTTQPIKVDRRKSSKHLALLDGMRKLAKKRESTLIKQQQAAMRKPNEAAQPKPPFQTPQEYSRLKYDREVKMAERQEQYRLQVLAQSRAAYAQRSAIQAGQQHLPNGTQARNVGSANGNGSSPTTGPLPNGHLHAGMPNQPRMPHHPLQALPSGAQPNGVGGNMMGMKGIPQGALPNGIHGQTRAPQMSPENMRMYLEVNRIQDQQQRLQQQRQMQQQMGNAQQNLGQAGSHSSPNMNNAHASLNNGMMNSGIQAPGAMGSPSLNAASMVSGGSGSPRAAQPRPLSNGVTPTIHQFMASARNRHPNLAEEEISKIATESLNQYRHSMSSQAAMNAAAGNSMAAAANYGMPNNANFSSQMTQGGGTIGYNHNQYAQMMRAQQQHHQQQQRSGSAGAPLPNGTTGNNGRQASRGGTPQTHRSGSGQASVQGKSPRPPQAQPST